MSRGRESWIRWCICETGRVTVVRKNRETRFNELGSPVRLSRQRMVPPAPSPVAGQLPIATTRTTEIKKMLEVQMPTKCIRQSRLAKNIGQTGPEKLRL